MEAKMAALPGKSGGGERLQAYLAKAYLQSRGLNPEWLPEHILFRFHPAMPYWEDEVYLGRHPAMLALVSGADGQPVTIHRTFLTQDGKKGQSSLPKEVHAVPVRPQFDRGCCAPMPSRIGAWHCRGHRNGIGCPSGHWHGGLGGVELQVEGTKHQSALADERRGKQAVKRIALSLGIHGTVHFGNRFAGFKRDWLEME